MGKPILLILSHAIEEHDQIRLLTEIGHDVFSLGGYIDPHHPHRDIRGPVLTAAQHPELAAAVDAIGSDDNIRAAAEHIPDAILDWLGDDGIIIAHHYLEARIYPQTARLRDWLNGAPTRRLIRRTVGQSVENNEREAQVAIANGLRMETVRYSPREVHIPGYTGQDALIRFYKDPEEWKGWTGEDARVLGFGQDFLHRAPWTNPQFWLDATEGLPRVLMGSRTDEVDFGVGEVSPDELKRTLRAARVYLYTGTQPASYTLGLIEAMMTGTPVVSIGPRWMQIFGSYSPLLFEGHYIAVEWTDHVSEAHDVLERYLAEPDTEASEFTRERAIELFGIDTIREQWAAFLA